MTVNIISAQEVKQKLESGAVLVDIRAADEYRRENITEARSMPLEHLTLGLPTDLADSTLIFHCKSGIRTKNAIPTFEKLANGRDFYILEGGIEGWKKAGFSTNFDRKQPLEMMRQVHLSAGSLVLLGAILGYSVSPAFYLICAFVGAGLITSGATGFCGMAKLLSFMPWNKQ
ncbi:rhodanese family protein [Otariodibacter oris]|uniref:Rhodanese-related sulfurtransferase n=1 Tax=Otariodibacter oris TaxID=1032623 RepID=A0A420XFW6_9PAST|nr:rhodanese family protein [Otariodibacter oris]QGM80290.1 hypothetical protein A6A10_02195 [Otariodibacter oris]RKR71656.1 rhodanese-related sulfurtransferase [Otariodibacter oris]